MFIDFFYFYFIFLIMREALPIEPERARLSSIEEVSHQNALVYGEIPPTEAQFAISADDEPVCDISVHPNTHRIMEIVVHPFTNADQTAEKPAETICHISEEGRLIGGVTRGEAREQGLRYLVVSTCLFHGTDLLTQTRSDDKRIDPGLESVSAHGVAKLLQAQTDAQGTKGYLPNIEWLSIINAALEIGEELRHGENTAPFRIRMWYGTLRELNQFATENHTNDPNLLFLRPVIRANAGYPIENPTKPRHRALFAGHIFADTKPEIVHDPAEVKGTQWVPVDGWTSIKGTEDAAQCLDYTVGEAAAQQPVVVVRDLLQQMGLLQ